MELEEWTSVGLSEQPALRCKPLIRNLHHRCQNTRVLLRMCVLCEHVIDEGGDWASLKRVFPVQLACVCTGGLIQTPSRDSVDLFLALDFTQKPQGVSEWEVEFPPNSSESLKSVNRRCVFLAVYIAVTVCLWDSALFILETKTGSF